MLFVLRLLPASKRTQQKIIFVTFFSNFAITVTATVSYSIKCIPFTAIYRDEPYAKCLSQNVIIATQYVNASKLFSTSEPCSSQHCMLSLTNRQSYRDIVLIGKVYCSACQESIILISRRHYLPFLNVHVCLTFTGF